MANKKRLIDANALIESVGKRLKNPLIFSWVCSFVRDAPTVDTIGVVHGEWEFDCACEPYCSVCGEYALQLGFEKHASNYCPNCGADMRERKEGE